MWGRSLEDGFVVERNPCRRGKAAVGWRAPARGGVLRAPRAALAAGRGGPRRGAGDARARGLGGGPVCAEIAAGGKFLALRM